MKLCSHLKEIIEHEIANGNKVISNDNNWSLGVRVITLEKPIDTVYINKNYTFENLEYWENHDSHYPVQKGYMCKDCNISIASLI